MGLGVAVTLFLGRPAPTSFEHQRLDWTPCQAGLECAGLTVPADHFREGGRTIKMAVARLAALDPSRRLGSVVINFGGPGIGGIERMAAYPEEFAALRARYDLVTFDPRGVGASAPFSCHDQGAVPSYLRADLTPEHRGERDELVRALASYAAECERRNGWLMPYLNTTDTARDLDLLRSALGEEKLTYLGFSYGGALGTAYAQLEPDRVGRMVLDSPMVVSGDTVDLQTADGMIDGLDDQLKTFARDCGKHSGCPVSRVFMATELSNRFQLLDTTPLRVRNGSLSEGLARSGVIGFLEDRDWDGLREALKAFAEGDGQPLFDAAVRFHESDANMAINCADSAARPRPEDIEAHLNQAGERSPMFGRWVLWQHLMCEGLPANPVPEQLPLRTAPVLVVGTTDDPVTSFEEAQFLRDILIGSELLTVEGDGHTSYASGNDCADKAIEDYLFDGVLPEQHCEKGD